ncbi:hypothetical protein GSI_01371 [Ganoderma sinense ZZ0214-1]|uniref:Uncharacterized protein n=1 Tax=Ganoderma sinense ZZ0214-1 TaxID=1077348 RepID=A0A2G8SV78_9APHY|nr:hypothetical protein GSI_01371 [Ganoderma sinense ZZ0214-1]
MQRLSGTPNAFAVFVKFQRLWGVFKFKASFYTYEFTFPGDEKPVTVKMSACDSLGPHTISLERATCGKSPAGCKKALIARFDDGSDTGIFMVKEMLTKYLGFEAAHVEMLYYNVDVANGAKSLTGCHPTPTAVHFKEKFVELLAAARPGDKRFLYVDVQGTQKGGDDCNKDDGKNGGFAFAEGDCGTKKELVTNGWISETIRKLRCGSDRELVGGGIIDTTAPTPGLLAGCHETQSTVKALKDGDQWVDPWTYAINRIVARRADIHGSARGDEGVHQAASGLRPQTEVANENAQQSKVNIKGGDINMDRLLYATQDVKGRRYARV